MMKIGLLFLSLLCFAACSPAIPERYLARLPRSAPYPAVKGTPEPYLGAFAVWGGTIGAVRNSPEGTYIEIIESPLDGKGRPASMEKTRGRFLALIPRFAEPELYVEGKEITVAGTVRGMEKRPLGEILYAYPVLLSEYDHLWKAQEKPDVHVGIGVGAVFGR